MKSFFCCLLFECIILTSSINVSSVPLPPELLCVTATYLDDRSYCCLSSVSWNMHNAISHETTSRMLDEITLLVKRSFCMQLSRASEQIPTLLMAIDAIHEFKGFAKWNMEHVDYGIIIAWLSDLVHTDDLLKKTYWKPQWETYFFKQQFFLHNQQISEKLNVIKKVLLTPLERHKLQQSSSKIDKMLSVLQESGKNSSSQLSQILTFHTDIANMLQHAMHSIYYDYANTHNITRDENVILDAFRDYLLQTWHNVLHAMYRQFHHVMWGETDVLLFQDTYCWQSFWEIFQSEQLNENYLIIATKLKINEMKMAILENEEIMFSIKSFIQKVDQFILSHSQNIAEIMNFQTNSKDLHYSVEDIMANIDNFVNMTYRFRKSGVNRHWHGISLKIVSVTLIIQSNVNWFNSEIMAGHNIRSISHAIRIAALLSDLQSIYFIVYGLPSNSQFNHFKSITGTMHKSVRWYFMRKLLNGTWLVSQ